MLHPANKKLLVSILTDGLKEKASLLHPQPLLNELLDLGLLEEQETLFAVNPTRVVCFREGGQDQFFAYVQQKNGFEIEHLNDSCSTSFVIKTKTFRDALPQIDAYLKKQTNSAD